MYDKKNNKNKSAYNQSIKNNSNKRETFIVLYERYLLDGNLKLLDKLFYAFFVSLHCAGNVIDLTNAELSSKIKEKKDEFISVDKVKESLKRLEDLGYIKRYNNKKSRSRIIVPVIQAYADYKDESKASVFYDRYGNEYRPVKQEERLKDVSEDDGPRCDLTPRGKNPPPPGEKSSTVYNKDHIKEDYLHNLHINEPKKKNNYSEEFEKFWSKTNKRGEKVRAYSAWKSNNLDSKVDIMIDLLKTNYDLKYADWGKKYWPHISSWINYRPWEEGAVLTEEEVIAKAHEQLQSTKDNLPVKQKTQKLIKSDVRSFYDICFANGVFIEENVLEAFIFGLKDRNISTDEFNLNLIAKELFAIQANRLDVTKCIQRFLMSSWKSFSMDYFKKDIKNEKGGWIDDPFAPHNIK